MKESNQKELTNMKRMILAAAIGLSMLCWRTALADTWTDESGVVWTYTISDGAASVGGGNFLTPAIPRSTQGDIVIPATLGGFPVTSIAQCAFQDCKNITSLEIPDSVTTIKRSAFAYCVSLRLLKFGNGMSTINYGTGSQIVMASTSYTIFNNPFVGLSSLVGIEFGTGSASVNMGNFSDSTKLRYVFFPASLPRAAYTHGTKSYVVYVTHEAYPDGAPETWADAPVRFLEGKLPTEAEPYDFQLAAPNAENGLVAYYKFDGDARDYSGFGNDGTVNGTTLTTDRHGNTNSAYYFGDGNYIQVSDSVSLDSISDTLTIAAWIYVDDWYLTGQRWAALLSKGSYQYCFNLTPDDGTGYKTEIARNLDANFLNVTFEKKWMHVAVSFAKDKICRSYVNGRLHASESCPNASFPASTGPLYIGMHPPQSMEYFNGAMDELRIYNRALSDDEISEIYALGEDSGSMVQIHSPEPDGCATATVLEGNPVSISYAFNEIWGIEPVESALTNRIVVVRDSDGIVVGTDNDAVDSVTAGRTISRTGLELASLQNLACGTYRVSIDLNADRTFGEVDYGNNTNSTTFTVIPSVAVTFVSEGDTFAVHRYGSGKPYGSLPAMSNRVNYDFVGWFTEEEGGVKVETTNVVPHTASTLYARWTFRPSQTEHVRRDTIKSSTTWRTGNLYIVDEHVAIPSGATLTIEQGVIVKFAAGESLIVNSGGMLNAQGTRAMPIVFTSIKDDANGGDTNRDGETTTPHAGDWATISVDGGTATFNYAKVLYSSGKPTTGAINMTTKGGTVTFANGEIAHGAYDAVGVESGHCYVRNTVIHDCLLAFRHWTKDPIVNCVIYDCGRLTQGGGQHFYNCIFLQITETWEAFGFPQNGTTYRNCCFWNEGGSVLTAEGRQDAKKVCGKNGNIWANPLFINPEKDDFRIAANSPCVDAGDGSVAPEKDYYGLERRDVGKVTDSGVPSANGNCPDIGIHEVIWDDDDSPYDIAPTAVSIDKTTAKIGDTVKVSWTIQNLGTEDVVGGWHDAVSLVSSSGQSVELGEVVTTYTLKRKMSMNVNGTFTIHALPEGTWYARVNTNSRRSDVPEGRNTTNNVLTATQGIAVSVDATPYANGASGTLSVGNSTVVKFTFPAGTTGQIARVSVPAGLSVSYGLGFMPQGAYASGTMTATEKGEAMFHVPAGTTEVYLVMDAAQSEGQNYSVSFEDGDLAILSVSPNTVPSSGSVSITINGAGFEQNTTVSFVSGSSVVAAQNVRYVSAEQLVATFNGSEWTGGNTVSLRLNGGTAEFANAFTVANTQGSADLVAKLILPDSIRERRIVTGWIEVENQGNVDAELPFYFISSTGGYEFNYAGFEAGWRDNLFIVAVDSNERVVVGAGEKYRIPFFVRAISQKVGDCILSELDESKSLNIETVCDQMNWDVSDNNLMMNVARLCGSTWLDFASNVRRYLRNHPIGAYYSGSVEKISADYLRYNSMGVPIIGRVFDNNGSVIANCQDVMLCMESEDTKSVVIARAHTDANGFYYFPGLSNGVYSVEIPTYTLLENCLRLSGNGMVHDVFANEGNVAEVRGSVSRSDFFDSTNMVVFAINEHLGYYREIQITNNEFLAIFPALCNGEWRFGLSLNNSTLCETFTNIFEQKSVVPLPEVEFLTVRGRLLENSNVVSDYTVSCASMVGAPVVSADGSFSFVMLKQTNDVDETIFFNRNNMQYAQKTFSINANELEQNLGEIVVPTMVHVKGHIYEIDDTPIGDELITICDSNGFSRVVSLTNAGMLDVFLKEGTYFIAFDEAYEVAVIQVSAGMDNIEVRRQPINRQTVTTVRDSNRVVRLKATGEDLSNAPISELRTTESFLFTLACAFPSDPQALLRFYLGDDGAEVRKLQKGFTRNRPWEFGPNSSLSQEAKTTDDSWYKKTYKDIKGSIYGFLQGHCSFDSCSLSNGEKPNLNDGFRMDFNPKADVKDVYSEIKAGRKKLFLSFGGMNGNAGDIYLEILSVIRTESDDGCSATYNFDVIYHGKDEYDFATHRLSVPVPELVQLPSGEMFYTVKHVTFRLGVLEAANPPWALSFWTELQIQDHFEVTITKEKPKPPTEEKDRKRPKVPQSCDPNEMVGPDGTGEARYVQPGEWMNYTIYFENKTNATAAAQEVYVTNPLSEWLDWSTFEMGEVSFGNQIDIGLSGSNGGASEVQMNGTNYAVRTTLSLETTGGTPVVPVNGQDVRSPSVAKWYMRIVDNSDETTWPADPYAGFLPPNDPDTHCGEGHISYRIKVRDDAPRNVVITNSATIVFDYNAPIETDPAWWNTVARIHDVEVELDGVTTNLTLIAGEPFGELPAPTQPRAGYMFDAWYTGENGTGTKATPDALVPTGAFSLYANWIANNYVIAYSANGGEGKMPVQTNTYDLVSCLTSNAFTYARHAFCGWATNETGEVIFEDGAEVLNLSVTADAVVELYAVWADGVPFAEFSADAAAGDEGGNIVVRVSGGNVDNASRVDVYLTYNTAVAADVDLAKGKLDGTTPKGGLKFPLTLTWEKGEIGEKTITIPIKADKAVEGDEFFTLQLAGAQGVELGGTTVCTVTIKDANTNLTLQEGMLSPTVSATTKGDGKWFVASGSPLDEEGLPPLYHVESPALAQGKSSTLALGAVKGMGVLYFSIRFSGDPEEETPSRLDVYEGKTILGSFSHADVTNEWAGYKITVNSMSGSRAYSFVFTQGSDPNTHVEISDVVWDSFGNITLTDFYRVYAAPDNPAGGVVSGSGWYSYGQVLKLAAKPFPGWTFDGWYEAVEDEDTGEIGYFLWSESATVSYKINREVNVFAVFEKIPYVRGLADPADGGKVSGSGYCAAGKKVTLKATASKNYAFVGWLKGSAAIDSGREPSTAIEYVATTPSLVIDRTAKPAKDSKTSTTITNVAEDVTYFAVFKSDPKVTVAVEATDGKGDVLTGKGAGKYVAGTITGEGKYAPGKKATLKATANKGYVFAGWYDGGHAGRVTLPDDGGRDGARPSQALLSQAASLSFEMPSNDVEYVAMFVTAEEDKASIALSVNGAEMAAGAGHAPYQTNVWAGVYLEWPVAASALSEPKVKVAGLPAGLKFTDKPVTKKIGSGKTAVTVTNILANTIYGAPTTASKIDAKTGASKPSAVKITVTTAGKSTQTYQIDTTVDALPAWAQGTFAGGVLGLPVQEGDGDENAQAARSTGGAVSLAIAANGKISGKLLRDDGTWTLAADSFSSAEVLESLEQLEPLEQQPVFHATVIGKSGKREITNEVTVAEGAVGGIATGGPRSVAAEETGNDGGQGLAAISAWTAWQYNWKVEPWKTLGKSFDKKTVTYAILADGSFSEDEETLASALGESVTGRVTLKLAASGAVGVAGEFVTGYDEKRAKYTTVKATGSATLVPVDEERGETFIYLTPKGLSPHARSMSVPWPQE